MASLRQTRRGRVLLRVFFYSAVLVLALPATFCHAMTHVPAQPTSPPPHDFKDVRVPTTDGLRLRGWVGRDAAASSRASVLIVHGFGDNLQSYLEVARSFRRAGHPVLLIDLRAHGGSEGRGTTLGAHETRDVRAGLEWLHGEGLGRHGTVLVGYSLGAVASLLAAANRTDVRAVIVDSPFDSLRDTVAHHGELIYGIPRWVPLGRLAIAFAEIWKGFDADDVDAVAAARRIRAPLLAIAGGVDVRMPEHVVRRIVDAHPGPHELWVVGNAGHVESQLHPQYDRRLLAFLQQHGL